MRTTERRHHVPRAGSLGFSLVELLVVVAIIGLLSSIVVVNVVSYIDRAKIAKAHADLARLRDAVNTFRIDHDRYPSSLDDLVTPPPDARRWTPYLMDGLSRDPWDHDYIFRTRSGDAAKPFELLSLGADGIEGGEGIDADLRPGDHNAAND